MIRPALAALALVCAGCSASAGSTTVVEGNAPTLQTQDVIAALHDGGYACKAEPHSETVLYAYRAQDCGDLTVAVYVQPEDAEHFAEVFPDLNPDLSLLVGEGWSVAGEPAQIALVQKALEKVPPTH